MREEVVELRPDRRFSYVLLSGLPVRGYRADVDLEPTTEGTLIRWRASFDPTIPGTGWLIRRRLAGITQRFVRGLAERAAALAGQPLLDRGGGLTPRERSDGPHGATPGTRIVPRSQRTDTPRKSREPR